MDKFDTKLENFRRALLRLQEGWPDMTKPRINSWRGMALFNGLSSPVSLPGKLCGMAAGQGHVELNSPKSVMRQAFANGLVSDNDGWISLLNDRNRTSHIYDENTAEQIFQTHQATVRISL